MLAGQHTSFGRGGFVARSLAALGRDRTQHHRVVASASSPLVARLIRDDLQQPWPKSRTSAKSTQSIERLDECLLRRVLRFDRIAQNQVRDAERYFLKAQHQTGVRVRVALARTLDQRVV